QNNLHIQFLFFSESGVPFDDKDNSGSKYKDEDCAEENSLGNDSSKSDSESSSESDSDTSEADAEEPNEEPENKESQHGCVESVVNIQQHCEHCKIQQGQQEQVTPRRLSRGQLWLKLDGEGVYQCTITGLIFEVAKGAIIEYSLLSWTKYAAYIKEPWIIVGPIFDVKCTTPSALTSIQFPHTLCLNEHLSDVTFNVFHFKNNGPEFECSVDHSTTHIKWKVSSLSPVGPVIERYDPVYYHGVVILYKVVSNLPSLEFRVYMASNNSSVIKDVSKSVKRSPNTLIKIEKPPCHKLLQGGKKYRLISDPEADITPEEIEFGDHSSLAEKPFFEVYLEQPVELTLSLVDLESEETVWKAKLRESDWTVPSQNDNKPKRITNGIRRRKSSNSLSGDEHYSKRLKGNDISDGIRTTTVLTDQQLMILAKKMGKDWKVLGIQCLKMSVEDIEQIEAKDEDINIYKCMMLRKWRDSEQNNGTAQSLYDCIKDDASYEVLQILKSFLAQT
uniref:Caspase recruitment domain family member 8 n=1 Tax=Anolis carolinensis TaxID=28377 RepID=R4GAS3_ANOCA